MKRYSNQKEMAIIETIQNETVIKIRPKSLLEAFDHIVELAKDSNLDPENLLILKK